MVSPISSRTSSKANDFGGLVTALGVERVSLIGSLRNKPRSISAFSGFPFDDNATGKPAVACRRIAPKEPGARFRLRPLLTRTKDITTCQNTSDGISSQGHHDFREGVFLFSANYRRPCSLCATGRKTSTMAEETCESPAASTRSNKRVIRRTLRASPGLHPAPCHGQGPNSRNPRQAPAERIRHCRRILVGHPQPPGTRLSSSNSSGLLHRATRTIPWQYARMRLRRDDRRCSSHQRRWRAESGGWANRRRSVRRWPGAACSRGRASRASSNGGLRISPVTGIETDGLDRRTTRRRPSSATCCRTRPAVHGSAGARARRHRPCACAHPTDGENTVVLGLVAGREADLFHPAVSWSKCSTEWAMKASISASSAWRRKAFSRRL